MTRGVGLFALVCFLATVPLYDRPLGVVAVLALVLILLTPAIGRKQAAKHDGEDEQPTTGKVS